MEKASSLKPIHSKTVLEEREEEGNDWIPSRLGAIAQTK